MAKNGAKPVQCQPEIAVCHRNIRAGGESEDFTDRFLMKCGYHHLQPLWSGYVGKIVNISRYITAEVDNSAFGFAQADEGKADYPTPFSDALITRCAGNQKNPASGQRLSKPDTQQGVF
nr:hypothetical protein [Candidatus Arsenophonus triatominarum]